MLAHFSEYSNSLGSGTEFCLCHHAAVVTLKGSSLCESFSLSLANVLWWKFVVSLLIAVGFMGGSLYVLQTQLAELLLMAAQLDVQTRCSHLQPVMLQDPFPLGRR